MAELTVPQVFPPDDSVAMFCVAMAIAANDVEHAVREAVAANPDDATDADRDRTRFSFKVRLVYGFLFEGIDALKGWRSGDPGVQDLLRQLSPEGAGLLTQVAGLEQRIGPNVISHVRQNTFHVPHPEPSKASSWIEQLSAVVSELEEIPATIPMGQTVQRTFPFADKVAQRMALRRHDDDAQQADVADGAVAFVNLVRHIHLRYCEQRGIKLELGREDPEGLQVLRHQA
ncbi:MAG: hypothetical protein JWO14_1708 [Solirubrobacterales bacterium]|nr:hypothetical protein [Solirubrobacterales bacterium]